MTPASAHAPARPSRERLRHALGHFATGVTVVTTVGDAGEPLGTTASAFSSLSLDPPLLLVCLACSSVTLAALREHGRFVINVLAADQRPLSYHFAQPGPTASWDDVSHRRGDDGLPLLDGTVARFHCRLEQVVPGGDHEIVIGRLSTATVEPEPAEPLLHYRGAYASLSS